VADLPFFGLAVMHARGEGIPPDLVRARTLYAQAVELGDAPNDAFEELAQSRAAVRNVEVGTVRSIGQVRTDTLFEASTILGMQYLRYHRIQR
jgi:hypothetical protein